MIMHYDELQKLRTKIIRQETHVRVQSILESV